MAIVKGAGMVMKAIIEVSESDLHVPKAKSCFVSSTKEHLPPHNKTKTVTRCTPPLKMEKSEKNKTTKHDVA